MFAWQWTRLTTRLNIRVNSTLAAGAMCYLARKRIPPLKALFDAFNIADSHTITLKQK
jgi:hypothetical protein